MLNGKVVCICRRGADQHQGDPSGVRYQPAALDYRELIRARSLAFGGGPAYVTTDQSDIAWGLVRKSTDPNTGKTGVQGYPGGDLGIARGTGTSTGTTATINYTRQNYAGQAIDDLAQQQNGFDWDIEPFQGKPADLRLNIYPTARGNDNGVVVELDAPYVQSWSRTVDPSQYANSVFLTGPSVTNTTSTPGSAGAVDVADIATRPEGRWDKVIGTDFASSSLLDQAVAWYLNNAQVILPAYQIVMVPGWWQGPDHLWIGDTVTVRWKGGGLAVNDPVPCTQMQFDVSLDQTETVTLTAGRPPFRYPQNIPQLVRRLARLEAQ